MHVFLRHRTRPIEGRIAVPASKSLHQRALAARALADGETRIVAPGPPPGEDVRRLDRALAALGRWTPKGLGPGRERRAVDLGLGATGLRFATALATLREPGARTLVTGRPPLLARPHRPLRRALTALGAHVRRRPSGAMRVIAGGVRGGPVVIEADRSSQFASALLLIAPRIGGLDLSLAGRVVSRPYLELTLAVLEAFGIACEATGLDGTAGRIRVAAGAPRRAVYEVEGDASSAAPWWAAAVLTGGCVTVRGVPRRTRQADARLLDVLVAMGALVEETAEGDARVGAGASLRGAGTVDLEGAPDLLPLVGILGALAPGETRVVGAGHVRFKESDRRATTVAGLRALGGDAEVRPDGIRVRGGARLSGGEVDATGDHRIVMAFGVLGLVVPGVVIRGAEAVAKSYPGFLEALGHEPGEEPARGIGPGSR